ncbi:MAG: ParA family protein [Prevotella sp.]|nr:ParA family protein [Prevotella sp.]
MTKNRIIVFANQKGGVGKTFLCVMMAHWLHDQGQKVLVYDADPQQSIHDRRIDDIKANPNVQPPWEVRTINSLDFDATNRELQEAADFKGYVLIDTPHPLVYPGLASILQIADAVVIPFSYDYSVLQSTAILIKVLLSKEIQQETSRLFFVPNMIEENVGTKEEKEQAEESAKELSKYGRVTNRVKYSVRMQRCSTLSWNSFQEHATMEVWKRITNKSSRGMKVSQTITKKHYSKDMADSIIDGYFAYDKTSDKGKAVRVPATLLDELQVISDKYYKRLSVRTMVAALIQTFVKDYNGEEVIDKFMDRIHFVAPTEDELEARKEAAEKAKAMREAAKKSL